MDITANITGIEYKIELIKDLNKINFKEFNINDCPASCLILDKKNYMQFLSGSHQKEHEVILTKEFTILCQ